MKITDRMRFDFLEAEKLSTIIPDGYAGVVFHCEVPQKSLRESVDFLIKKKSQTKRKKVR